DARILFSLAVARVAAADRLGHRVDGVGPLNRLLADLSGRALPERRAGRVCARPRMAGAVHRRDRRSAPSPLISLCLNFFEARGFSPREAGRLSRGLKPAATKNVANSRARARPPSSADN